MGVLTEIKDILKLVAYNQKVAKWFVIIIVIVAIGGFFYLKYRPSKPESDCAFIKQQNKELLAFILEARRQVKDLAQPTSYIYRSDEFIFASYDTVPKSIPQQQQMQQKKAIVLLSKFDSVLLKVRQDSIRRAAQQKQ